MFVHTHTHIYIASFILDLLKLAYTAESLAMRGEQSRSRQIIQVLIIQQTSSTAQPTDLGTIIGESVEKCALAETPKQRLMRRSSAK